VPSLSIFSGKKCELGVPWSCAIGNDRCLLSLRLFSAGYIFIVGFKHVVSIAERNSYGPVVLILNRHHSYTRNVDIINISCKHGICVACLSPHFTHWMWTLDVSFISSFSC
jgi:hypothetical protein